VCVDEALLIGDGVDNVDIFEWRSTGSWQAANPLFNLVPQAGEIGGEHTLWRRNDNLDPGFEYPLFHLNGPLSSAGELGYLLLSEAGTGSVSLATAQGAALLDRFTAFPTNRPERAVADRIQPNSPYPEVIRHLFDEPLMSRLIDTSDLPDLNTLTNAWFADYQEMVASNACWNSYAELLPNIAENLRQRWQGLERHDPQVASDGTKLPGFMVIEDLLRNVAERVTFRQNLFVVIVAAQRLSPTGRVLADQRVAVTIVRDSYTGYWAIHSWYRLEE